MGTRKGSRIQISDIAKTFITSDSKISQNRRNALTEGEIDNEYDSHTQDIVTLNVGGVRHETKLSTLQKWPNTRLHSIADTAKASGKREFYFDRNPQIFVHILNYYRIGKLHIPSDICGPMAKAEIDYWGLDDKKIEQCCWVNYISYEDTMSMLQKFEMDEEARCKPAYIDDHGSFWARTRPKLWKAFLDPYTSKKAMIYAILSLIVVLVSITVFVMETLPGFWSVTEHSRSGSRNITSQDLREELEIFTDISPRDILLIIDNACNIFFFMEFIVKFIASPNRLKFFRSPSTFIEILALVPYYIGIMIVMLHPDPIVIFDFIRVLFATRVLRIFRIFVLVKHFLALKILMYTISASTKELLLLLMVFLIGVIIFSCIEYYMEMFSGIDTDIEHIPAAFWWAVVTMTTVGYGDIVPKSVLGRIVGACCAVSGVLVIALSVPVIVNNFTIYYLHAQARDKLRKKKKISEQAHKWNRLKQGIKENLTKKGIFGTLKRTHNSNSVDVVVLGELKDSQNNGEFSTTTEVQHIRLNQDGGNDTPNDTTPEIEVENDISICKKETKTSSNGTTVIYRNVEQPLEIDTIC
ncbi:hypothetical protein CHS0354_014559 [Potamilus streckersoni]|uniref:BTB domain-containing protein n=1 Tax=Potamilus streckersoni TaxID=2493646 RepID=A0AAE0RQL8_9BIVA|nr:hypothetical protein CHS0354_014559 [Potamilus streckersoni]